MSKRCTSDGGRVPRHVAIIMDGNGRWAQARGLARSEGHEAGLQAIREVAAGAIENGVEYLTLYAFSTENWSRPQAEVDQLMGLIGFAVDNYTDEFLKEGVRILAIGSMEGLPVDVQSHVARAVRATAGGRSLTIQIALNYGSRQEIVMATRRLVDRVMRGELTVSEITEDEFSKGLFTHGVPDPDLLIRTSGEERLSNFLLWQLAYSELYFIPKFWPDFTRDDLRRAIGVYAGRDRRFGGVTSEINE